MLGDAGRADGNGKNLGKALMCKMLLASLT